MAQTSTTHIYCGQPRVREQQHIRLVVMVFHQRWFYALSYFCLIYYANSWNLLQALELLFQVLLQAFRYYIRATILTANIPSQT